jgi:hypothetical protein
MKQVETKYWFKRRRYGYGYTPVTWQGWLSVAGAVGVIVGLAFVILPSDSQAPSLSQALLFTAVVAAVLVVLVKITYAKGPTPARWRWGKKPEDNPREDI